MAISQSDYFDHDGLGLAGLLRRREATPADILEAALARAAVVNPGLNAIITPMEAEARATVAGLPDGGAALDHPPFWGVPFLLKDLGAAYAGVRLANGSRATAEFVPDADGVLVGRYKRAGLVIFGKTNTPEFGLSASTEPALFGPTRNPWDPSRSPGGSSGGAAAAVAAGIAPMAHGSDGGGSIRIPAACCGVLGLKPTRARITSAPAGESLQGLAAAHALTRTVRDCAALLDATAGPAAGDPYYAAPPVRPFLDEVGADPGRLTIGMIVDSPYGAPVARDCVAAAEDAAALLESLGHAVRPLAAQRLGADRSHAEAMLVLWDANLARAIAAMEEGRGRSVDRELLEPATRAFLDSGRRLSAIDLLAAEQRLHALSRHICGLFEDMDVLLTPTLAQPPAPLGVFAMSEPSAEAYNEKHLEYIPFTPLFNVTGQPAMSVPLYWNAAGLPIGVQLAARYGDEATLFRLAAQLEAARPWAGRLRRLTAQTL